MGSSKRSNRRSQAELPPMPNFSSARPTSKPEAPVSAMNALIPLWPRSGSTAAKMRQRSASRALEMNRLSPSMRQPPPARCALVWRAAASEPADGSLSAKQPSFSPLASARRVSFFWASLP